MVDASVLEDALFKLCADFPGQVLKILEIGICHGDTSRGLANFCHKNAIPFEYTGIDSGRDKAAGAVCADKPPFDGARVIQGESEYVYKQAPEGIHLVFCDGCHDVNHVMLDFLHYGDRVVVGGILAFHDAAPKSQGKCDWQGYGPKDDPDFGTATREAFRKVGLIPPRVINWALWKEAWDDGDSGGVSAFVRTA